MSKNNTRWEYHPNKDYATLHGRHRLSNISHYTDPANDKATDLDKEFYATLKRISGVTEVSFRQYKIRFEKGEQFTWQEITHQVDQAYADYLVASLSPVEVAVQHLHNELTGKVGFQAVGHTKGFTPESLYVYTTVDYFNAPKEFEGFNVVVRNIGQVTAMNDYETTDDEVEPKIGVGEGAC